MADDAYSGADHRQLLCGVVSVSTNKYSARKEAPSNWPKKEPCAMSASSPETINILASSISRVTIRVIDRVRLACRVVLPELPGCYFTQVQLLLPRMSLADAKPGERSLLLLDFRGSRVRSDNCEVTSRRWCCAFRASGLWGWGIFRELPFPFRSRDRAWLFAKVAEEFDAVLGSHNAE